MTDKITEKSVDIDNIIPILTSIETILKTLTDKPEKSELITNVPTRLKTKEKKEKKAPVVKKEVVKPAKPVKEVKPCKPGRTKDGAWIKPKLVSEFKDRLKAIKKAKVKSKAKPKKKEKEAEIT